MMPMVKKRTTLANDIQFIRRLTIGTAGLILAGTAVFGLVTWRANEFDKYRTCLRGNETRQVIRTTFEDIGDTIDHLAHGQTQIRTEVIDPNVKKLSPRPCTKP